MIREKMTLSGWMNVFLSIILISSFISFVPLSSATPISGTMQLFDPDDPPTSLSEIFDDSSKSIIVRLKFDGPTNVTFDSGEVSFGPARSHIGDPVLLRVQLFDRTGQLIDEFNHWNPLQAHVWELTGSGEFRRYSEKLVVQPNATGNFVFSFNPNVTTMKVIDIPMDRELISVDLTPIIQTFCQENPDDPDCQVSDMTTTVGVGNFPHNIAFNPSNNMMYVTNLNDDTVSVIDNTQVTSTINVDDSPLDLAFNPSNERMYVTNYHQAINPPPLPGTISVIDDTTITDTINTDIGPNGIAFNPTNNMMYLVIQSANRVNVISDTTITDTVIPVGETPYKVAFNPANNMMYVTNHLGDSVSIIDGTTNEVINTISVGDGPVGLAFNSENERMYVANFNEDTVSIIDGDREVGKIPVGDQPIGVAYNPSNNMIYVTNQGSDDVSVIDGDTVVDTIQVGDQPIGVAYNPSNQNMYVVNSFSASVSVLESSE